LSLRLHKPQVKTRLALDILDVDGPLVGIEVIVVYDARVDLFEVTRVRWVGDRWYLSSEVWPNLRGRDTTGSRPRGRIRLGHGCWLDLRRAGAVLGIPDGT